MDDAGAPYIPTPKEIADGCAKIRSTWNDAEYTRRAAGKLRSLTQPEWEQFYLHWSPPVVSAELFDCFKH